MKRKFKVLISSLIVSTLIITILPVQPAMAAGITVAGDGSGDYTTIQDAIDNAGSGDTITVMPGTYNEWLTIDKQLIIKGMDRDTTILQASTVSSLNGINILYTNGVNISGLTIMNYRCGIYLQSSNDTVISNCVFKDNDGILITDYSGIETSNSNNNTVTDNTFLNNEYGVILRNGSKDNTIENNAFSGNNYGIRLNSSTGNHLNENTISTNSYGLFLEYNANENTIENNEISYNQYQGIYMTICNYNRITGNDIHHNSIHGIFMVISANNTVIEGNNISNNGGTGVFINTNSTNNIIVGNTIADNTEKGIHLFQNVTGTQIFNNLIENNDYGVYLFGAHNGKIYNNNFINNTTQAYAYSSSSTVFNLAEPVGGNYWSNWNTPDSDSDGFVDSPYQFGMNMQDDLPWAEQDGWISNQPPDEISIQIDIKPGSEVNSINPDSNGVIAVAVLTTDVFDAADVNTDTVTFGPGEASPVHYAIEDVDGDGDMDLILHFKTRSSGIEAGDTEATLKGETSTGIPFEGTDSVRTVPPAGKKK